MDAGVRICEHCLSRLSVVQVSITVFHLQVADAGRTEVAPGSITVLAIGGVSELVDQVSGKLRTL